MLVRSYLEWSGKACAQERADAAQMLARAYLGAELSLDDRYEAEAALTLALDDGSALVRRALAEVFCCSEDAPHHIIAALAGDQSDVGALVLARSPILSDGELVDCAAMGDSLAQIAIAMRPALTRSVAAAIAEVGALDAVVTLLRNAGSNIPPFSFNRIVERFGAEPRAREALLDRPGLPVSVRQMLVRAVSDQLKDFVISCGWMSRPRAERATDEARDLGTLTILHDLENPEIPQLVTHLRQTGQLTPLVLLRGLLCAESRLFVAALADLAGMNITKVHGHVYERGGAGFPALYRKAGLPDSLEPAFKAALAAIHLYRHQVSFENLQLQRPIIQHVIRVCTQTQSASLHKLIALLHRFDAEAAREEAKVVTATILASPAPIQIAADDVSEVVEIGSADEIYIDAKDGFFEREADAGFDEMDGTAEITALTGEDAAVVPENVPAADAGQEAALDGDGNVIFFDPREYSLRRAA